MDVLGDQMPASWCLSLPDSHLLSAAGKTPSQVVVLPPPSGELCVPVTDSISITELHLQKEACSHPTSGHPGFSVAWCVPDLAAWGQRAQGLPAQGEER